MKKMCYIALHLDWGIEFNLINKGQMDMARLSMWYPEGHIPCVV